MDTRHEVFPSAEDQPRRSVQMGRAVPGDLEAGVKVGEVSRERQVSQALVQRLHEIRRPVEWCRLPGLVEELPYAIVSSDGVKVPS
jgi:hypothetical protein